MKRNVLLMIPVLLTIILAGSTVFAGDCVIEVIVRNAETGALVQGATVALLLDDGLTFYRITDSWGIAEFPGVLDGLHAGMTIYHPDYETYNGNVMLNCSHPTGGNISPPPCDTSLDPYCNAPT